MPPIHHESDDIAQLEQMAREFELGFNTGDVDRIMRFYGATYVDVNLRNPVQSWAERRAYYARIIERSDFRLKVRPDEIRIFSDFALVRGTLTLVRTAMPRTPETELRYLEIARRQTDGSWQVIWGMDGPVQEYTPGAPLGESS